MEEEEEELVEAVVVRGCLSEEDLREIWRVFDRRFFGSADEFCAALGKGEEALAGAVMDTVDALSKGEWTRVLVERGGGQLGAWRDKASHEERKHRKEWRAVLGVASLLEAHFASLRGRWNRALLEPLLEDAAWRDVAATALAAFPESRALPTTDVWPEMEPLDVPSAFGKFEATREFADLRLGRETGEAFVVRGFASSWPAMTRWKDPVHLRRVIGHKMMPIELGSNYMAEDFEQKLMPFSRYLEAVLSSSGKDSAARIGYLAHTPLLHQIPQLVDDIVAPAGNVEMNIWFGPAGTVSPLHTDPKDNVFVQVVGRKCVLLFSPSQSHLLYPVTDGVQTNTSSVSVDDPDVHRFPLYSQVAFSR